MPTAKHKPGIHLLKGYDHPINGDKVYYYWHIVSRNGRIIARSSETYTRKSGAVKSIKIAAHIFQDSLVVGNVYKAYYDHTKKYSPLQSYL
jgi:hypothetical protein